VAPSTLALVGLFVLALFYTLYFARAVMVPIALAVLASFLLRPLVRGLQRLRIPESLGAALIVVTLIATLGLAIEAGSGPVADIVRAAPKALHTVEARLRPLRRPVEDMGRATEQVERLARGAPDDSAVVAQHESLASMLATSTQAVVVQAIVVMFLLYFLLSSGTAFVDKLARILPTPVAAAHVQQVAHDIESEVSIYLVTVTFINASIGVAIGLMAWGVGLPHPLLWGLMACVMNFIPYIGALVVAGVMTLTALAMLPFGQALLVPASYALVSGLEAYLVTPLVLGRRLMLDPVAVFLGVIFWGWLWGAAGALIAVPLLVVIKITCDHIEQLAPLAEILGRSKVAAKVSAP
jgi:predicted PurR-regulated permease PerM